MSVFSNKNKKDVGKFLRRPTDLGTLMIDEKLVNVFEYNAKMMSNFDNFKENDKVKVLLYPIEIGNILRIENKKTYFQITLEEIQNIIVDEERKGLLKSQNLFLKIMLYDSRFFEIDLSDNQVAGFLTLFQKYQNASRDFFDKIDANYGSFRNTIRTRVYYKTPFLANGEEVLWHTLNTSGIFSKKAKSLMALTNFRVLVYDFETMDCGRLFLTSCDDVVIKNSHRVSNSTGQATFTSVGRGGMRVGTASGGGSSRGYTVGDVVFMMGGRSIITFGKVTDPSGVKSLARSAIKNAFLQEVEDNSNNFDDGELENLFQEKNYKELLKKSNELIEETDDIRSYHYKAYALKELDKMEELEKLCKKILQRDEKDIVGLTMYALSLGNQQKIHEAIPIIEKALALYPDNETILGLKDQFDYAMSIIGKNSTICTKCSNDNPQGSKFCNNCGYTLR